MREDKAYAKCFSERSEGHAVYKNESAKDIRPGACGYFDYDGSWVIIVQTIPAEPATRLSHISKPAVITEPKTGEDSAPPTSVEYPVPDQSEAPNQTNDPEETDALDQAEDGEQTKPPDQPGTVEPTQGPTETIQLEEVVKEAEAMDLLDTLGLTEATKLMGVIDRTQITVSHGSNDVIPTTGTFNPLEGVRLITKADQEAWGVVQAGSISLAEYEAMVKTIIPGAPVEAGFLASYKTQARSGAVLATHGTVTYNEASPTPTLEAWVEENMQKIMDTPHGQIIKKRGFWIVTKTYTATRRAIAILQSRGSSVSFGVDVSMPNIAKIGPSMKWWDVAANKPGWKVNVNDDGIVLFMSGIYWQPRLISKKMKVLREKEDQIWLAAGDLSVDVELKANGTKEYVRLMPKAIGEIHGAEKLSRLQFYDVEMEAEEEIDEGDETLK